METGYQWLKNKWILISGAIIIICLIVGGSIYGYHQHQVTAQKQNLKLEREKYIKAINKAKFDILQSAALSENMINKYLQVWHDAIDSDYNFM